MQFAGTGVRSGGGEKSNREMALPLEVKRSCAGAMYTTTERDREGTERRGARTCIPMPMGKETFVCRWCERRLRRRGYNLIVIRNYLAYMESAAQQRDRQKIDKKKLKGCQSFESVLLR